MKADEAFNALQRQELMHKFVEIGKVLLTWAILKNVDMVVQRVVFLHEELMKLPSFPRKALEADLDLYKGGEMGKQARYLSLIIDSTPDESHTDQLAVVLRYVSLPNACANERLIQLLPSVCHKSGSLD
ncbi:Protein unc-80 [Homalodisca vitripennis]|nr:Protein unc-80 [Homalodisca vitripennis]